MSEIIASRRESQREGSYQRLLGLEVYGGLRLIGLIGFRFRVYRV